MLQNTNIYYGRAEIAPIVIIGTSRVVSETMIFSWKLKSDFTFIDV